ncbi:MAG TPA: PAS domain-containing protein [Cyclobacteriaceae bacterium]|nr:PAS domain-containing protein [Cyclobacteriaceae bacterium]
MKKIDSGRGYTWIGISLGVVFPILAIIADLLYGDLRFSMNNVLQLYSRGPLHWIILSAPVVLGSVFYFFEKAVSKREAALQDDKRKNEEQLRKLEASIVDIEQGDLSHKDYDFENPQLTSLLTSLKGKLLTQKKQDDKARWVSEGHAKFGEIFRGTNDLVELSHEVIRNLVQYAGLNQASIFIHETDESDDEVLTLKACYAYDRKKYISRSIKSGEGLIGQCYLEKETLLLTKVPNDYIKITSGLGEATPKFVAIIPIKANDQTEGILELAGFTPLESFEVEFIEKVCEAFASVIRSVKVASETKRLLDETKSQTEQLQAQEEEIKQNIEEMHATQEQLTRQLEESRTKLEQVEKREEVMGLTTMLSEADLDGNITYVNDRFCEVANYQKEELLGVPYKLLRHPDMPIELFKLLWQTIRRGETFKGVIQNKTKDGEAYWVDATIIPIKNGQGEVVKYMSTGYHITDHDQAATLFNQQADRYNWPRS